MTGRNVVTGPGDTVGVKYRIERELGAGGLGTVFEVSHGITGKHFALKLLRAEAARTDAAVQRFLREARVAAQVQHPNIVDVHDVGQDGSSFFVVMELLHGESLAKRLERRHRLHPSVAAELLVPCMEGVAAAHAAGVIHGDLKPANIFLARTQAREAEVPKVLDLGVMKLFEHDGAASEEPSARGAILGTPQYMAPEQLRSLPIDARTDVYAFGVILYELLAGVRPFDAASFPELLLAALHEDPPPLESRARDLPAGLARVVAKAMAREREARFESVHALMHAFQRTLQSTRDRARQDVMHFQSFRPGMQPALVVTPRQDSESLRAVVTRAKPFRAAGWPVVAILGALALGVVVMLARPRPAAEAGAPPQQPTAAAAQPADDSPERPREAESRRDRGSGSDDSSAPDAGVRSAAQDR